MKYLIIFLIMITLVVSFSEGVIEEVDFDELIERSDLILLGNVTEIQPSFHAGDYELTRDQFFHDVKLSIEETMHGDLSTNEISFRIVKDRQLEDDGASISTSQDFEVGERVVVFLEKDSEGFWGGNYNVVGMSQGKYLLSDGKVHGSYFDGITEEGLLSMIEEKIKEERQRQKDCKPVTIDYQIEGGTLTSICKQSTWLAGLTAEINADSDGEIILDVPKNMVFSLGSIYCDTSNTFIVLVDGKEILPTVTENGSSNLVKVPFTEGDHEIQVAGTSIIPSPAPTQYCGIVMGYDSLYLPPKFQIERGMEPEQVKCNEGLGKITKSSDDSPACVQSETKQKLIERGWTERKNENAQPEPEGVTDTEIELQEAKDRLETAYYDTVNLGTFYIKDVIVGFGTHDNTLVIDIPSKYIGTNSMNAIKQDVRHIVGDDIPIDYVLYDEPIEKHIATVIPYLWNQILHQRGIEFMPKNQTYWNNADGFRDPDRVCSPIVTSNGSELYISSTFELEPFKITGTDIDKEQPDDCHKIWKTETIMVEPDRVTALWLKNQSMENEN